MMVWGLIDDGVGIEAHYHEEVGGKVFRLICCYQYGNLAVINKMARVLMPDNFHGNLQDG